MLGRSRNAPVHHPDAFGPAVLRFDFPEKIRQRRLVAGVAGQDFIGHRKAFERDDECNDHWPVRCVNNSRLCSSKRS